MTKREFAAFMRTIQFALTDVAVQKVLQNDKGEAIVCGVKHDRRVMVHIYLDASGLCSQTACLGEKMGDAWTSDFHMAKRMLEAIPERTTI